GMRNVTTMEKALKSGACQLIGVGRPFCYAPEDCGRILKDGGADSLPTIEQGLSMERGALGADVDEKTFKTAESFGLLSWYCLQLLRIGKGEAPDMEMSVFDAMKLYKAKEAKALDKW